MKLLRTVDAAKKDIKILQSFVDLVESYEPTTIEQHIIKEYAILGSINKVVETLNENQTFDTIDALFVTSVLKSKPQDSLHKLIKSNYLLKTRPNRRKQQPYFNYQ